METAAAFLLCVDDEVLKVEVEGDMTCSTVLMGVWVLRGERDIGLEYAWMRLGVLGGEGPERIGGVGYGLVPKVIATLEGRRPVLVNPSQAD
jgi:hypothetical protein